VFSFLPSILIAGFSLAAIYLIVAGLREHFKTHVLVKISDVINAHINYISEKFHRTVSVRDGTACLSSFLFGYGGDLDK
jgi:hypothetical protein